MYIVNVILAIVLLAIGGLCIGSVVYKNILARDMKDSKKWSLLKNGATVVASVMEKKTTAESIEHGSGEGLFGSFTQHKMENDYVVSVAYKYTYKNNEYTGKYESVVYDDKIDAQVELNKYVKDSKVNVYVKIDEPKESKLHIEQELTYILPGIGMGCAFIFAMLLLTNVIKFGSSEQDDE